MKWLLFVAAACSVVSSLHADTDIPVPVEVNLVSDSTIGKQVSDAFQDAIKKSATLQTADIQHDTRRIAVILSVHPFDPKKPNDAAIFAITWTLVLPNDGAKMYVTSLPYYADKTMVQETAKGLMDRTADVIKALPPLWGTGRK